MAFGNNLSSVNSSFPAIAKQDTNGNGDVVPFSADLKIIYTPPPNTEVPPILLNPASWNPGKHVYGYGRASDDDQRNSPDMQQSTVKARAASLKGDWAGFFCDFDVSGRWVPFQKRPVGAMLMKHLLAPGDKLVVDRLDRLARSAIDGPRFTSWCHQNYIDLYICHGPSGECLDMTNAAQMAMVNMFFVFGQYESDLKSERVKEANRSLRRRGLPWYGHRRWGFTRQPAINEHGKLVRVYVPHEREREQIRLIQKLHDSGLSFGAIWDVFHAQKEMQSTGKPWATRRPDGRKHVDPITDACRWYESMMVANNYVENWEDWKILGRGDLWRRASRKRLPEQSADAPRRSIDLAGEPLPDLPSPSERLARRIG